MSRVERQVRRINPRSLYTKRRKNSADIMLLNSLAATETLTSSPSNNNPPASPLSKSPTPEPDTDTMGNNVKLRAKQVVISPTGTRVAPEKSPNTHASAPPVMNHNSLKSNTLPKTPSEMSRSVIVNLALSGSNIDDKRRLARLLREVNEMREIRERHDSFASDQSLEANILKTEEQELQRITKIQRSKKLLFKYKVYDFLKRPASFAAMVYHIFAFMLVAACLVLSVYPAMERQMGKTNFLLQLPILDILEKTVLLWFTTEYILMLWASECRPQYQGLRGKIAFIKSPAHLIDLLVIILSAALPSISSHDGHEVFAFRAFRGFHRFFQVLQVIALKRQLRPWQLFWSVLYDQREQLMIIFYLEIILLCSLSYLGFLAEHEANENLANIADSMWWSVVTLTTVGYGDKVPITWAGKVISGFFILFGVAVFALPAGIIGAGLALKLEEVERSRQRRRKKEAAAKLIQRAWKCYRANHAYLELSLFFRHQPGDLFKMRVYDNISRAFIAMVRFHMAKSHFKEVTRPVDLRNVIESYKYGQMDIFARLKQLNSALDIIITRMSVAENERVLAINQLASKLEAMELASGESGSAIHTKSDGTFHLAATTGSPDTAMGTPGGTASTGVRYLDMIHIPPMPQTNTHPSTIPLRSRPNSHHHSFHHHSRPYSTPASHRNNSLNHSDHTITTIDEMTNESRSSQKFNNSSISFLIEDYSHKSNQANPADSSHAQSSAPTVLKQRRRIHRRHSQ